MDAWMSLSQAGFAGGFLSGIKTRVLLVPLRSSHFRSACAVMPMCYPWEGWAPMVACCHRYIHTGSMGALSNLSWSYANLGHTGKIVHTRPFCASLERRSTFWARTESTIVPPERKHDFWVRTEPLSCVPGTQK